MDAIQRLNHNQQYRQRVIDYIIKVKHAANTDNDYDKHYRKYMNAGFQQNIKTFNKILKNRNYL